MLSKIFYNVYNIYNNIIMTVVGKQYNRRGLSWEEVSYHCNVLVAFTGRRTTNVETIPTCYQAVLASLTQPTLLIMSG